MEAALTEEMHFNRYWAFHAVGAVIDTVGPGRVELSTIRRLRQGLALIPEDSDRARTLRAVLARVDYGAA
ncbi:hypothetical protein MRQ86_02140 [Streptomyces sp. MMS21 TC-5]|uniref:hypothetical protein n=1 Tax=Streptomyces sp. MMS21 TC-5 TaxID=2925833 RepID=UPI001F617C69|nr:hypothetical protein [Streptomyces sp. MMS21 TC-5]MCI4079165.1 hypothetical protein [Streptomyces sp. MMS21 TC-5]